MSDGDASDSASGSEDLSTTGLIATRAKRSTAGNLYATLRANLDDEELQKELLAEDEEDVGDYQASDREDDDQAMESSSDDEDAGLPKEGEMEDLEGEKELKKAERAAAKRRRKMDEAKLKLPTWQKKAKRVKIDDQVQTDDGTSARPKKKSERSNWLPTAADAPVRQSTRASAIANREVVHTNLKESAMRSENQKKIMAKWKATPQAKKRAELTQEERLAKAAKIEKETAREFGRWEREEAERQRIREEQLAAKRNRGIAGPVIRHWSGSVLWEGDKIKMKRLHGSQNVDEIAEEQEAGESNSNGVDKDTANVQESDTLSQAQTGAPIHHTQPLNSQQTARPEDHETNTSLGWLDGIQEYAAQQPTSLPPPSQPDLGSIPHQTYDPSTSTSVAPAPNPIPISTSNPLPSAAFQQSWPHPSTTGLYPSWPPGYQEFPLHGPQQAFQPTPLIKEQAHRSLILLEQFENLNAAPTSRRGAGKAAKDGNLDPNSLASTLLPLSYPSFSTEEARYLTGKLSRKKGSENLLPPVPSKTFCSLTTWPAKFRDPKTGLPYADLQQYKMIQRIIAGACAWSGLLGAWVGPGYGSMGRATLGVPPEFSAAPSTDHVAGDGSGGDGDGDSNVTEVKEESMVGGEETA